MVTIIILVALTIALAFFALVGFQHLTKGTPIRLLKTYEEGVEPPHVDDTLFRHTLGLHTGGVLYDGHAVELLTCGDETYPRLWADLRAAKVSITLQMYYCKPGRMANEMRDILIERAQAGVTILFLHDAFGSHSLEKEWFQAIERAGVRCATFRAFKFMQLHKLQSRSHIRVVVIDGKIGYTGGFGLDDKWYGDGRHKDQWRDTNVRFTGPAVMQLQATFADGWCEPTGELLAGRVFFPIEDIPADGPAASGIVHAAPTIGSTIAERLLALSIVCARERLYISNAYFVPDDDFRRLLTERASKGVDVRILTAGRDGDVKSAWYAGRARYEELLRGGVRIYEYRPTMMHAKTLVADATYTMAGTMNFDNRSMAFNDETVLITLDRTLGRRAEEIFFADLEYSDEIMLDTFRKRPFTERLLERGAQMFQRVL